MLTRRSAFSVLGALALAPAAALAQASAQFRGINVDVGPLRTNMGDDTANWVAQALPEALAQSLGPHLQSGARNGALLTARIDLVYLGPDSGPGPFASSQDTIAGTLIVHGPRGTRAIETPLRATTSYYPMAVDQPLRAESNRARIVLLSQAFARWTPGELGL